MINIFAYIWLTVVQLFISLATYLWLQSIYNDYRPDDTKEAIKLYTPPLTMFTVSVIFFILTIKAITL